MSTEETQKALELSKEDLRDRLVKDQGLAETQLKGVLKQLDDVQSTQHNLARQRIALETLINYLKTVLT